MPSKLRRVKKNMFDEVNETGKPKTSLALNTVFEAVRPYTLLYVEGLWAD